MVSAARNGLGVGVMCSGVPPGNGGVWDARCVAGGQDANQLPQSNPGMALPTCTSCSSAVTAPSHSELLQSRPPTAQSRSPAHPPISGSLSSGGLVWRLGFAARAGAGVAGRRAAARRRPARPSGPGRRPSPAARPRSANSTARRVFIPKAGSLEQRPLSIPFGRGPGCAGCGEDRARADLRGGPAGAGACGFGQLTL